MSLPDRVHFETPCGLTGSIRAPGSKSYTHRGYLTALLRGGGTVHHPLKSEDTEATYQLLSAFDADVSRHHDSVKIATETTPPRIVSGELNAGESGTLLRFLIPITTLLPGPEELLLTGEGSLKRRDHDEPVRSLSDGGYRIGYEGEEGRVPIRINPGQAPPEEPVAVSAQTTSQHLSGWLLALAATGGGEVILDDTPVSRPYVEMTVEVIREAGAGVEIPDDTHYNVEPFGMGEFEYDVPGDYSSAAFFLAGAVITGGRLTVEGLRREDAQADREILPILESLGARIEWPSDRTVTISGPDSYSGFSVDASMCPDLVPILTVLGSFAEDTVHIENIAHLANKESNRIEAPCRELEKLGVSTNFESDRITIEPSPATYRSATVQAHNDHRLAMAFSIFGCRTGDVTIEGADCVAKSYPGFYRDLSKLGGKWES